jgi:hypothetical protein
MAVKLRNFSLDASAPGKIQLDTGVTVFSTFDAALFFYYARSTDRGIAAAAKQYSDSRT